MPTIGVAGVSGTGKTSILSALFGTGRLHDPAPGLTLLDAPGLGEDLRRDDLDEYAERLRRCDVILWVLAAPHRGLALDQSYLDKIGPPPRRLVFALNQVDLIRPGDWLCCANLPSERQEEHLLEILEDRKAKLASSVGQARPVVACSATRAYRLQELFTELVLACPPGQAAPLRAAKNLRSTTAARVAAEQRRERSHLRREGMHP
jgi:predicted GTPase